MKHVTFVGSTCQTNEGPRARPSEAQGINADFVEIFWRELKSRLHGVFPAIRLRQITDTPAGITTRQLGMGMDGKNEVTSALITIIININFRFKLI